MDPVGQDVHEAVVDKDYDWDIVVIVICLVT